MKQNKIIQSIEQDQLKKSVPRFRVGDTLNVHLRIAEGEKERVQQFNGIVIAMRGRGLSETFALYRSSHGAGIERVFMLHSPKIAKIEVVKTGRVRKSKLYYLRGTSGKASKVKEQMGSLKTRTVAEESSMEGDDTVGT